MCEEYFPRSLTFPLSLPLVLSSHLLLPSLVVFTTLASLSSQWTEVSSKIVVAKLRWSGRRGGLEWISSELWPNASERRVKKGFFQRPKNSRVPCRLALRGRVEAARRLNIPLFSMSDMNLIFLKEKKNHLPARANPRESAPPPGCLG